MKWKPATSRFSHFLLSGFSCVTRWRISRRRRKVQLKTFCCKRLFHFRYLIAAQYGGSMIHDRCGTKAGSIDGTIISNTIQSNFDVNFRNEPQNYHNRKNESFSGKFVSNAKTKYLHKSCFDFSWISLRVVVKVSHRKYVLITCDRSLTAQKNY